MKFVIISDSHSNINAVNNVFLSNIDDTDYFIFLGDSLEDYNIISNNYKNINVLYAYGNCDYNPLNQNIINFLSPNKFHKIMFCHGHTLNVKNGLSKILDFATKNNATIILYGHTHISYTDYKNDIFIMNPGSISFPRDGKLPSYGILEINDKYISSKIISI